MEEKTNEDQKVNIQGADGKDNIKSVEFSPLNKVPAGSGKGTANNIDMLMDIHVPVLVELGKTEMLLQDILGLSPGSIIELDSLAGEPVTVTIRGTVIAYGEVVVVDENFGVKVTKIVNPQERIKSMG